MLRDRKALVAVVLSLAAIAAVATSSSSAKTADHRGGTLKLLAKAAGGTLDPQVNYTLQYWQLYQATYDGLLAFQKAGGGAAFNVVPDLASGYKLSNGGKTWTFTLRTGIKFSNG
jgi:peptide/nickel transport system substrate-binding protein